MYIKQIFFGFNCLLRLHIKSKTSLGLAWAYECFTLATISFSKRETRPQSHRWSWSHCVESNCLGFGVFIFMQSGADFLCIVVRERTFVRYFNVNRKVSQLKIIIHA